MKRNRGTATILALGLLGANILVLSGTAEAAKPKCMGKTATIVGNSRGETINGTKGADVIVGNGGNDVIDGKGGNDVICGASGSDIIFGGGGRDTIYGKGNIDLIFPGNGDDTVDGGDTEGTGFDLDIVDFTGASGVVVNLQTGTATGQGTDDLANLEAVYGSDGNDDITGNNGSNILFGGPGNDIMNGGGGFDYASYWFAAAGVNASLETGVATGEGTDTLVSIEGLLGTIDFNDVLIGDNKDNYLDGDLGDNMLDGRGGDDLFLGAAGNDTIIGGDGDFDMVDYFCGVCALTANLGSGEITGDGTDTVSGIEAVGADGGDDTLIGDEGDNIFFGWGGNDVIQGMGGDDELDGGAGPDSLNGGPGTDKCANSTTNVDCEETPGLIDDHPLRMETELIRAFSRHF